MHRMFSERNVIYYFHNLAGDISRDGLNFTEPPACSKTSFVTIKKIMVSVFKLFLWFVFIFFKVLKSLSIGALEQGNSILITYNSRFRKDFICTLFFKLKQSYATITKNYKKYSL